MSLSLSTMSRGLGLGLGVEQCLQGDMPGSMDRTRIDTIKRLYQDQVEGTELLYADVGYFMRTMLWCTIEKLKWDGVLALCEDEQEQEKGHQLAQSYFQTVLGMMGQFIRDRDGLESRNLMIADQHHLKQKFKNDAASFVKAMTVCLKNEKEIIFRNKTLAFDTVNRTEDEPIAQEFSLQTVQGLYEKAANLKSRVQSTQPTRNGQTRNGPNFDHYTQQEMAQLLSGLAALMEDLKASAAFLRKQKALQSIKCLTDVARHPYVVFKETATVLDMVASIFGPTRGRTDETFLRFQSILGQFMQCAVIEDKHPQACVSVNKEENKGSTKKYGMKKKESINTELEILGNSSFQNIVLKASHLELILEKNIQDRNSSHEANDFGILEPKATTVEFKGNKIKFSKISITGYARTQSDQVYEQFLRLRYNLTLCVNEAYEFVVTTLSLPFLVSTGAIQNLELIGSHMWYIANSEDLYNGDFRVPDSVPVEKVLDMLNMRMPSTKDKKRPLSQTARQLLKDRLQAAHSDGMVSLRSFIKPTERVKRKKTDTAPNQESFAFFTWFYALVNTIENSLLTAWTDGIIYELMTYEDACQLLMKEDIPEGTCAIRFQLSKVLVPNSLDAHVRIVVEIKVKEDGKYQIAPVPIDVLTNNKNTLYHTVTSIVCQGQSLARFICLRDRNSSIDMLRHYKLRSPQIEEYHNVLIQGMTNMMLRKSGTCGYKEEAGYPQIKRQRASCSTASSSPGHLCMLQDDDYGHPMKAMNPSQDQADYFPTLATPHYPAEFQNGIASETRATVDGLQNEDSQAAGPDDAVPTRSKARQSPADGRNKRETGDERNGLNQTDSFPNSDKKCTEIKPNTNLFCGGHVYQPSVSSSTSQMHSFVELSSDQGRNLRSSSRQRNNPQDMVIVYSCVTPATDMDISQVLKKEPMDMENENAALNPDLFQKVMNPDFLASILNGKNNDLTELSGDDVIDSLSEATLSPSDSGWAISE